MMTPLDKPLRRELDIDGRPYTLTVDPEGLKLVEKGRRKGITLRWQDLVSGDAALATALQASLQQH
ncbi:AbrB/MazE/SpoVT family DNA-binding domain-containing protein [Stenotrophomonas maltophilia]